MTYSLYLFCVHDSHLHASVDHRNHFTQKVWKCTTGLSILSYSTLPFSNWMTAALSLLECPGLARYCELETILVSGQINEKVSRLSRLYPELTSDGRLFQTQMDTFHSLPEIARSPTSPNLEVWTSVLRNMKPAMRAMFPHVESLVN